MCRWFSFISLESIVLEDVLIDPEHSIQTQVYRRYAPDDPDSGTPEFNLDGFGIAWYTNTQDEFRVDDSPTGPYPAVLKTITPPVKDANFISICGNTASKCILAHIRASDGPPPAQPNNHPFVFGRHSFMHNGTIADFPRIRPRMLEKTSLKYSKMIHGSTDTEHLAALYMTNLDEIGGEIDSYKMRCALEKAIEYILEIQTRTSSNSFNICATDGVHLIALRYRNSPTGIPRNAPSLFVSFNAARELNRLYRRRSSDIPSEKALTGIIDAAKPVQEVGMDDIRNDRSKRALKDIVDAAKPVQEVEMDESDPVYKDRHGPHVIVSSEPVTLWGHMGRNYREIDWMTLCNKQIIMVDDIVGPGGGHKLNVCLDSLALS